MNERRCQRLINRAIKALGVNLCGQTVLTEAATGYYVLTPLIALLAGAERVYALTQDSPFGRAAEASRELFGLARRWGVHDRVEIFSSREDERIGRSDIVTNLGFVRPLDGPLLRRLKRDAVIPLMWETWEYRPADLDLAECRRLGIPVLGTNEHHPELLTFNYVGHVALKLLFEAGVEIFRSRLLVVGSGEFADQVLAAARACGAEVSQAGPRSEPFRKTLPHVDALVVAEHHDRRPLIAAGGEIEPREVYELNPGLTIAHISGWVDRTALASLGLACVPERFAPPGHMSVATDYVGPRPLIDLHVAGLKVGGLLARARARGLSPFEAELSVLNETPLAQGFDGYHNPRQVDS